MQIGLIATKVIKVREDAKLIWETHKPKFEALRKLRELEEIQITRVGWKDEEDMMEWVKNMVDEWAGIDAQVSPDQEQMKGFLSGRRWLFQD